MKQPDLRQLQHTPIQQRRLQHIQDDPGRGGCGIVALAELEAGPSHELVELALEAIGCMEHRGGCLDDTGDGAGLLLRPERAFFERFMAPGRRLDEGEPLVVGTVFFLRGERNIRELEREFDAVLRQQGLSPLGWREVPVELDALGARAREDAPRIRQVLVGRGHRPESQLHRALWSARRRLEAEFRGQVAVPSLSPTTTVYKALASSDQLRRFYADLRDPELRTQVVLGHRRYATNTFSNWHLVQPFRLLAHNGEINTIRANTKAVRDAEALLGAHQVLQRNDSDSAHLDRAVEFMALHLSREQLGVGDLAETMRRMLPPSWSEEAPSPRARRFFEASARALGTLGAWEGPAGLVATDGHQLVAQLDRMGLRPLRYLRTRGGRVIVASEMGAVTVDPAEIVEDGQLEPGGMLVVDLDAGRLVAPGEATEWIVRRTGVNTTGLATADLLPLHGEGEAEEVPVEALNTFGWTRPRAKKLRDTVKGAKEPVHSMGNDTPLAIYSENRSRLYSFLNQIVAVVTNPAIDPLREGAAMDLTVHLGQSPGLDRRHAHVTAPQYTLPHPVLTNEHMAALRAETHPALQAHVLDCTFTDDGTAGALTDRLHELADEAARVVGEGRAPILVISDRRVCRGKRLPAPALFAVNLIHRRLAREGLRRTTSLVVEAGEVHESHDLAALLAYGATAVNPYAMFHLAAEYKKVPVDEARDNLVGALVGGLKRIMSKMGITTIAGYRGSVLFEAIGLSADVVDYYLPGTQSRVGGVTIEDIYGDIVARAEGGPRLARDKNVAVYRKEVTNALQMVARNGNANGEYDEFARLLEETPPVYLRDLIGFTETEAIPVDEVVDAREVISSTMRGSAMSHGAIHSTAHRAIAAAFNEMGSRSNSGEGGEDIRRNPGAEWESDRNKTRQIASGRFGVDAAYLVAADEIEIKIGQGAKPGEGGHLPGGKVNAEIAAIRKTRPGVDLISPPPHHDIYSIEDLAQLIRHLREVNPAALITVKTPSVTNLGTICVGVAKAGADIITISGCEGGTGAAASGSILHAGLPLELGLTDAHQYLVANGIRHRVKLRADGGVKYGQDVVKILALGADEVGFGTPLMVAENCVFCRGCNKGNCPVGLATQDEDRQAKKFMVKHREQLITIGTSKDQRYVEAKAGVTRYVTCLAEDVRQRLAALGLRHPAELTGRVDLLRQIESGNPRWDRLVLTELLIDWSDQPLHGQGPAVKQQAPSAVNARLLEEAAPVLEAGGTKIVDLELTTADHAVGATLAGRIAQMRGLPEGGAVVVRARGYCGQGFGFAATRGMSLRLEGYANDVVGEVMSEGADIVLVPPAALAVEKTPHLAGNAVGYGATGGRLFIAGTVGQRFGVRNSGATLVCEGTGKYAFEYMTGGVGVVLGAMGPCIGSGMTGGELYLYEPDGGLRGRLHEDAVPAPVDALELERLKALLTEYAEATGSPKAQTLLADWETAARRFLRVESRLAAVDRGERAA